MMLPLPNLLPPKKAKRKRRQPVAKTALETLAGVSTLVMVKNTVESFAATQDRDATRGLRGKVNPLMHLGVFFFKFRKGTLTSVLDHEAETPVLTLSFELLGVLMPNGACTPATPPTLSWCLSS